MKALNVQLLLRLHGLQHVADYLKLDTRELGDLVLFKYRQIEADWSKLAVRECRGLILDKSKDWEIVSYPYDKFFNLGEGYCDEIDWDTAEFYTKEDGSLINFYYYKDKWCVQTSGSIDSSGNTNVYNQTFHDLVMLTIELQYCEIDEFLAKLDTTYNYMFELCTPDNVVVIPHKDYEMRLHGVRDMKTLQFVKLDTIDPFFIQAKKWTLSTLDEMYAEIEKMPWLEEGFVVVDAKFRRSKCKNPKYVAVHHVTTGVSPYAIMNIIKTNEVDEFLIYYKHKTEEVHFLLEKWNEMEMYLSLLYDQVKHIESDKDFAIEVMRTIKKSYTGMMFSLRNGKIKTIHEGMCYLDNRFWYLLFGYENPKLTHLKQKKDC